MLNVAQVAEKLGVSTYQVYDMVHNRKIPYVKLGRRMLRFDPVEIEIFIDKHRVKPKK